MQEMEFTVEDGKLYMLQTRTGKRTPAAAFRIAVDMANEKLITKEEAIERIKPEDIERLFYPVIDAKLDKRSLQSRVLATGINAVPGAAVGKVVFNAHDAEEGAGRGEEGILGRRETRPEDAGKAREVGAEGIGLVRTEHMFFTDFEQPEKGHERQRAIQEMILADTREARVRALDKLLPFQRRDFVGIFRAMDGLPVTIRLIDPPLHEFVPHERAKQEELARDLKIDVGAVVRRVEQLHEANPMLGHRGCRLCITYPEILEMQVRAIIEAAIECQRAGVKALPEIMHPLTLDRKELSILEQATRRVADDLIKKSGIKLNYLAGTMIELPRAALLADEIAEVAEFFSYGTNDLTQTTMGLSRDDAGRFLPDYVDEKKAGVFKADPFQSLDIKGVGMLMRWGIEKGRKTRAKLKVGICGEHGGDADSVKFCHAVGMDYVSASPFRVPISRLAAAQAVLEEKAAKAKRKYYFN